MATSQLGSIILHSLLLIATVSWLLELTLIHFAISTSTSESIQSSLPPPSPGRAPGAEAWRGGRRSLFARTLSLSVHFPSVVVVAGGGWRDGTGACLLSFRRSLPGAAVDRGFGVEKWKPQQAPRGLLGAQQFLSFASLDPIFPTSPIGGLVPHPLVVAPIWLMAQWCQVRLQPSLSPPWPHRWAYSRGRCRSLVLLTLALSFQPPGFRSCSLDRAGRPKATEPTNPDAFLRFLQMLLNGVREALRRGEPLSSVTQPLSSHASSLTSS